LAVDAINGRRLWGLIQKIAFRRKVFAQERNDDLWLSAHRLIKSCQDYSLKRRFETATLLP
jgi:hypothetical protein